MIDQIKIHWTCHDCTSVKPATSSRPGLIEHYVLLLLAFSQAFCKHPPFLPRQGDPYLLGTPEAAYLDRHFRLSREDQLSVLRRNLPFLTRDGFAQAGQDGQTHPAHAPQQTEFNTETPEARPNPSGSDKSGSTAGNAALQSLPQHNVYRYVGVESVQIDPRPCVMISFTLPVGHRAAQLKHQSEQELFWKESENKTLPLDAQVCLYREGHPMLFGTVVRLVQHSL